MNKWKKAISVGLTSTLLASLFTVIAASSAFAAVSVTGVGSLGVGSTSTAAASFTLSEETAGCITAALGGGVGHVYIEINPNGTLPAAVAGSNYVRFTGTPTLTAPGSLGASVSLIDLSALAGNNDTIDLRISASDPINKQQVTIAGVNVKAGANAATGAIRTTINDSLGGALATCFLASTTTASGTVSAAIGIGATSVNIAVSSSAPFAVTAGTSPGKLVFATGETVTVTAAGAVVAGIQTLTISATTVVHAANEAVTQANVPAVVGPFPLAITSVGTVTDTTIQDVGISNGAGIPAPAGNTTTSPGSVNPGENNQAVVPTYIYERNAGFIANGTTLTFTIAGALYSTSPSVRSIDATAGGTTASTPANVITAGSLCVISFDRKSCTVKTSAASTAKAAIQLYNILVDVDAATAKGTPVTITVTGVTVSVDYNTVANVSRVIVGVAAQPLIYINYNDQPSGQISLTEAAPGFFTDGGITTAANVLGLCLLTGETFTRAPWAVVTTGNLLLRNGLVGGTSVQGTLFSGPGGVSCAKWTVYLSSTTVSTIEIRGSDASNVVLPSGAQNGPRLSVPGNLTPGTTQANVIVGTDAQVIANGAGGGSVTLVSNATRAFKSGVVVTALSQPTIPRGSTNSLAGNIKISETLAGQFKANERICVEVQPRASNNFIQDTFFQQANTNDLPIVTTNVATTGLLVSGVTPSAATCTGSSFTDNRARFSFLVTQQAIGSLGEITISNIHMATTADAPVGPVLVRVVGTTSGVAFEAFISNAKIGATNVLGIAATRLGVTRLGSFTVSTKVAKVGKYVSYRFDFGVGAAGQIVQIWGATKSGNDWSSFSSVTTRRTNASGVVYYFIRQNSPMWKSYRAFYEGGGSWTPARQARWVR